MPGSPYPHSVKDLQRRVLSASLPPSLPPRSCIFLLLMHALWARPIPRQVEPAFYPVKKELKGHTPQHMWPQPGPGMPSWAALAQIALGIPCPGAVVCSSSGSVLQASHLHSSAQHPSAIWWHLHLHPSLGIMKIQAFVLLQHSSSMNVLTFMSHQETLCYVRILFLWHYLPQLRMSLPASAM